MVKRKALIIEDEFDLVVMIKKYLLQEHYKVEIATTGGDALALFNQFQPDIVILDLMLPEIDGLEILRQIRLKSTLPIIIISAKETELDRILGLKMGADDYLTKPFSIKELLTRMESIFRRIEHYTPSFPQHKELSYHHFVIQESSRVILYQNHPLHLTAKEFDLLLFLLKHPRQVLSKEQIYHQVWGINEYGDINTVTIHIQKIREKLGPDHNITTLRGIGYRFDGDLKK